MNTKILDLSNTSSFDSALALAADTVRKGGLVAFPTETVYGLGADALDPEASKKIYAAKGRPSDNPLIVHIAEPAEVFDYAFPDSRGIAEKLCSSFMPGPLTVVLKKKSIIPDEVTGGLDTVAIRCPSDPVAHAFIAACGVPIAAPSANLSGKPSPTRASHVIDDLDGRVDLILCGEDSAIGLESTIVLVTNERVKLLRPGFITVPQLESVVGKIEIDKAVTDKLRDGERPLAPGMKYRHYAPQAPVTMIKGEDSDVRRFFAEALLDGSAVICFDEDLEFLGGFSTSSGAPIVFSLGPQNDHLTQAKRLFDALRTLDRKEVRQIYSRLPEKDGVGLAVFNRLIKACGFCIKRIGEFKNEDNRDLR
ncbi:MAG: threonylcarbamoyl-AMP synthase [Clostridia bacterium]|nr:threonylcarbamoyl-AMP synthase [Clostridia bacterium]